MNKRGLLIGLLIMLAVITSGFTYAYWASNVVEGTAAVGGSVQIGTGESVTIDVTLGDQGGSTKVLVPVGRVVDAEEQSALIEISFEVTWEDDELLAGIADKAVSVLIENIEVAGVENPYLLINVVEKTGNPTTIALGGTVTFYFEITMSEPGDLTEYTAVAGKEITFDLTFTVTP
ncbi:MAG: hypothetical protein Q7I99_07675 [Acholeplasmataceae bacterium]|nr:hypothetical protein [Acholeplasmataceae bacterium]